MAMVYLLTQCDTLGNNGDLRHDRHVVAAYTDWARANNDLALFARDAFELNRTITSSNPVIVTFPGDSTVYTLLGRTYSVEECPLH